jgi:hypothetical protein
MARKTPFSIYQITEYRDKIFFEFGKEKKKVYFCRTLRGGAEVARWAHNPKVIGSNPVPATKSNAKCEVRSLESFAFCVSDLRLQA